jgi:hypothetical protein
MSRRKRCDCRGNDCPACLDVGIVRFLGSIERPMPIVAAGRHGSGHERRSAPQSRFKQPVRGYRTPTWEFEIRLGEVVFRWKLS